ncbi:MAG: PQQ-binding-like beta-propeller repeat protein [Planctomycetota bacterium]
MNPAKAATVLLLLWSAASGALTSEQAQWGQRYTRNMVSDETGLPEAFDPQTKKNVKWLVKLGTDSYATPAVAVGKVFIGTNNSVPRDPRHHGDRGVLMCFEESDGGFCWQLVVPKRGSDLPIFRDEDIRMLDWPGVGMCSTPSVEGDRVYMLTNRDEVVCLDIHGLADGNQGPYLDEGRHMTPPGQTPMETGPKDADILWLFDMPKELGVHQHDGPCASVLIHGQFLYVNSNNGIDSAHARIRAPEAPSLVVLDKTTGRLLAQDDEHIGLNIVHSTWSSPALGEVNGRTLIFFGGGNGVCYAFEALQDAPPPGQIAKLKKVWQFDCDPAAPKEDIRQYQGNRKVSPSNIKGMPVFYKNRVYVAAGGDMWWGKPQAWLKCIDATGTGDITKTGEVWSYEFQNHCMSTPSISGGLVFIAEVGRKVHCLDAETGKPCWVHQTSGEIWASTLAADGKVYIGSRRGDFWVLAASKEKKILSTVELGSPITATPVAANGTLYIATANQLYAVKKAE